MSGPVSDYRRHISIGGDGGHWPAVSLNKVESTLARESQIVSAVGAT